LLKNAGEWTPERNSFPSSIAAGLRGGYFVNSSRRGARRLLCRRDHECDPGVPAVGPVLVGEFPVAFEIEITLRRGAQRNDEPELRAAAHDLRLEAADVIARTAVATDLLVDIADGTDKKLFR